MSRPPAPSTAGGPPWLPPAYGGPVLAVLSGPTAVGKTSVLHRARELALPFHISVTATTRPRTPDEVAGVDYHFVDRPEFERMLAAGELLEHAEIHRAHLYGIPRLPVREALARGQDVLVPPDVQGAATLRATVPGVVTIFLAPPSFEDLEIRIRRRGREQDEAEVQRRLTTARAELDRVGEFDYLVVNTEGHLDDTVRVIDAILRAEKCRLGRMAVMV